MANTKSEYKGPAAEYNERKKKQSEYKGPAYEYKAGRFEKERDELYSRINALAESNNRLADSYKQRFEGREKGKYVSDSSEWLQVLQEQGAKSDAEAASIRERLDYYKDFIDADWSKSVLDQLDRGSKFQSDVFDAAAADHEYWSQWENEEKYNEALAYQKDYNEKLNYGLDAALAEIEKLESEASSNAEHVAYLQDLIRQRNKAYASATVDPNGKSAWTLEQLNKVNAETEALIEELSHASLISEKKQYYTLAKRIQDAERLAGVADPESENYDPEFEKYSGYVSTNPGGIFGKLQEDIAYEYINGDEETRAKLENKYQQYLLENHIEKGYGQLKDEEKAIYNYYYQKHGKEAAEEYLFSIADKLNARQAGVVFDNVNDHVALEYLFGVYAGLDQFETGMENLFNTDSYIPTNSTQLASGMVKEDLADNGPSILGSSLGQIGYDVINTTSNMLPSILVSAGANMILPGSGSYVGSALLGASAAGNAKAEMLKLGYSKEQANAYGLMVGASEAVLEKVLGGIPGLKGGDGIFSALGQKALSKIDNALARVAITIGGNMLDEGLEEGIQTILEPWLAEVATKADWEDPAVDEVLYSSLLGALSSIGFTGAGMLSSSIASNQNASKLFGEYAPELINRAFEVGDPKITALAESYQKKSDAGKTLSGAELNKLAQSVTRSTQKTGTDTKSDGTASDPLQSLALELRVARASRNEGSATENTTEKKSAVKTEFEASAITFNEDGSAVVKKGSGTVNVGDVDLGGGDVALVYQYARDKVSAGGFNADTANVFMRGFDGSGLSAAEYVKGFSEAYAYGAQGASIAALDTNESTSRLTEVLRERAYNLGKIFGVLDSGKISSGEVLKNGSEGVKINNNKENANNERTEDGVHIRDGGERNRGQNTSETVSAVEGRTGQAESEKGKRGPRDREASALTYGKEVTAKSIGIKGGLDSGKVHLIAEGSETKEMRRSRKRAEKRGLKATFFAGGNLQIEVDGEIASARAFIKGDRVYIRVDHPYYTSDQLMRHEIGHDMIARGEVDPDDVRERIEAIFGKENVKYVAEEYAYAYEGSGMSAEEIWEEIICDAIGNMNAFAKAEDFGEMNAEFLSNLKSVVKDNAKSERGPPIQKNTAESGAGKMSIDSEFNNLLEKWDRKTIGFSFVVGETSQALQEAGVPKKQIRWDASKIVTLLNKHSGMTMDTVRQIPELLESPIIVVDSKKDANSKIVMGDLYDSNGKIVTAVLLLTPTSKKGNVLDLIKISSAEGRGHIKSLFTYDDGTNVPVRYVDKKRIQSWLNVNRLQLPLHNLDSDSTISISQNSDLSTNSSKKVSGTNGKASRELDFFDYLNGLPEREAVTKTELKGHIASEKALTNRMLLANALESITSYPSERGVLDNYKAMLEMIAKAERRISDIRSDVKALSKDKKNAEFVDQLRKEEATLLDEINRADKKLLSLESTKALKKVVDLERQKAEQRRKSDLAKQRERAEAKLAETKKQYQEARAKSVEGRHKTEMRHKIKALKEKFIKMLEHPTERQYVPEGLVSAMVDVCELIDTSTELYKKDGSINKAQQARNEQIQRLLKLSDEYKALKSNPDPMYSGEYDEEVFEYLDALRTEFSGKSVSEMTLAELTDIYRTMRAIDETLQDARKLIGWSEAETVYEAGDKIIDGQRSITRKRKSEGKAKAVLIDLSLSPLRNVQRMVDYEGDSPLVKAYREIELGVRKKNKFVMEAHKSFEKLTTGENAKKYEDAIYKPYGKEYVDNEGRKFRVSKMQMMQAIMSYNRELANDKLHHVSKGGFTFADLDKLNKGKLGDAIDAKNAHKIMLGAELAAKFASELEGDRWAQEYMAAAEQFFDVMAKDAINDTTMILKHRLTATGKKYIPYEVDKNFVVREITSENDIQQVISGYGMMKDLKANATQPIIITGLNNVLERHIDQVGNIYGLGVPIRNFNKIWNVKSTDGSTTVQDVIERNWGKTGKAAMTQAVKDVQGPRINKQWDIYKKIKGNALSATFMLNGSVVFKQVGSMFSATSMLRWRDPASMMANLAYTMANYKKIAAEVDKYTATAWVRRQGLSDSELYTLTTEAKKRGLTRLVSKLPTGINPVKWIAGMDSAVALSLWKYAKEDVAQRTGLTGEELMRATAEFYDDVIENTQSMTDALHRPEIQKRNDVLSETLGIFKTDLYQGAGQLRNALGQYKANKSKENATVLAKTIFANTMSACWGSLMTTVFALLRYKVNRYRDDEDDELTVESWLEVQGADMLADMVGYAIPLFGSEAVDIFTAIKNGASVDGLDNLMLESVNSLIDVIVAVANSTIEGKMPSEAAWKKIITAAGSVFGVPTNNVVRLIDSIKLHAQDIANGEFFSFEAGLTSPNAQRLYNAYLEEDESKIEKASRLFKDQDAIDSAIRKALRENDPRIKEAAEAYIGGDVSQLGETIREIAGEGHFSEEDIEAAIRGEIAKLSPKEEPNEEAKDEVTSIHRASDVNVALNSGDTETALAIIDDLVKTKVANGMDEDKARSSVRSSLTSYWKPLYKQAYAANDTEEMKRIRLLLHKSGLYGGGNDVVKTVRGWLKE